MLDFARVEVGDGAPQGCVRCTPASDGVMSAEEDVVARIHAAAATQRAPGPNIALVGPEPFAHPALPRLVSACDAAGAVRIAIETDGAALGRADNAAGALHAGVTVIFLRVFATDESLSAEITGRPGLVAAAREGVRAFSEAASAAGVEVARAAVVPVCQHNLSHLPAMVAELSSWHLDAVRLVAGGELSATAAAPLVAAACDTGMVNRTWVETDGSLPLPETHRLHAVPENTR